MSKTNQSNYDKYGYTKTSIKINGKSAGAAECWKCGIPLHNTGITSLKRHRNRCKLDEGESTSNEQNTEAAKCFICDKTSIHCIPMTAESKHTKTKFTVFVRKFLNENKSERLIINVDLDTQMICAICFDKINEYDLASSTAERVAKEMCEILRKGVHSVGKHVDGINHSEDVEIVEVEQEISEITINCSRVDESLDGTDFVDFDHTTSDRSGSDTDQEKSMQNKSSRQNSSETDQTKNSGNKSNSLEAKLEIKTSSILIKNDKSKYIANQKGDALEDKNLQCDICEKMFSRKKHLARHMRLHTDQNVKMTCDICGKVFIYKWSLKVHMQIHANFKEYSCECGMQFNRRDKMLEHRKTHGRTKESVAKKDPYECSECSATFRILKEFKKHRTQHKRDEYPYRCSICNWDAKEESVLNKHVAMHDGLLPLQCVVCKKLLAHKRNMIPHMRLHTGEKAYQCERCGKEFFYLSSFSAHMRYVHDGVRTLKCEICPRLFIDKSDLKKHMIIHSGTKAFTCPTPTCLKSFTHRHNMMEHCKIHDKDPAARAHKCSFCGSSFNRKSNLTKHLEKHGAIVPHTEIQNKLQFD